MSNLAKNFVAQLATSRVSNKKSETTKVEISLLIVTTIFFFFLILKKVLKSKILIFLLVSISWNSSLCLHNFLIKDLAMIKFLPMHTKALNILHSFSPSDKILWKLSSKLIEICDALAYNLF